MQQFMVPQFIDVEDKIIGPITTRQFILMLVGALLTFIIYKLFSFWYFVAFGLLNLGFFATLSFAKVNGRPIHYFILNFVQTLKRPGIRIWDKTSYVYNVQLAKDKLQETASAIIRKEPVSGSRLADLTLTVNTGGVYIGEEG